MLERYSTMLLDHYKGSNDWDPGERDEPASRRYPKRGWLNGALKKYMGLMRYWDVSEDAPPPPP